MSNSNRDDDGVMKIDVIGFLRTYGFRAMLWAVIAAGLVLVAGAVHLYWGQTVTRTSVLEFRPTFSGAAQGQYPNGLPFGSSDVAAGPIVDLVYDANKIEQYNCAREIFRGGFFVEQRSVQAAFLDAEYQGRLADTRLTSPERQRLQAEYEAKRDALPVQYRLVFVHPPTCDSIPQVVLTKAMTDVLNTWASESETKRGVLNHQVEVLTPAMLDVGVGVEGSRLLRADLLRTSLWRIVRNIEAVEGVPGAGLVRATGEQRLTFLEVRNKLIDLVRSRLEPLVVSAGQSLVRESLAWVTETLASAEREQAAAEGRASAYQTALRVYSGQATSAVANRATAPSSQTSPTDIQTLSPQIDGTFIDRIIEMSDANSVYRRQLTQQMVEAKVQAVSAQERVQYYQSLLRSVREPGRTPMSVEDIDAHLNDIVQQGKALTKQFNDLYLEFSRVALRSAPALYQSEKPVSTSAYRDFTSRELLIMVAGTFFATLVLAFGFLALRDRLRPATR
jgi:hypothetical protein